MASLRLITFDVTGTLLKFRKPPVHQYMEIGEKYGIIANEERMKKAFKEQWKDLNETQPHYGQCWRSWWTDFVINTFRNSQAEGAVNEGTLGLVASELIEHFSTSKCWDVKEGAVDLLLALTQLSGSSESRADPDSLRHIGRNGENLEPTAGVRTTRECEPVMQIGVVSNFDSRLEQILRATQLHHFFDFFLTSHECQVSKPHQGIFKAALGAATRNQAQHLPAIKPAQALHIGDSYSLDFVGAVNAGWNGILVMSAEEQKGLPPTVLHANPPVVFPDLIQLKAHLEQITLPARRT